MFQYCTDIDLTYNQQPILKSINLKPQRVIPFTKIEKVNEYDQIVYFENDPQFFDELWNNFDKYTKKISKFLAVIQPDFCPFDIKRDFPLKILEYENLRSRLMAQEWQKQDINVIPTAIFGKEKGNYVYNAVMEGLPEKSTYAFQINGINSENINDFEAGLKVILHMYKPVNFLFIGSEINFSFNLKNYVDYVFLIP